MKRGVYNTFPPNVEYPITTHGKLIEKVTEDLHYWQLAHCKKIIGK